jgi:hypothetical protein
LYSGIPEWDAYMGYDEGEHIGYGCLADVLPGEQKSRDNFGESMVVVKV